MKFKDLPACVSDTVAVYEMKKEYKTLTEAMGKGASAFTLLDKKTAETVPEWKENFEELKKKYGDREVLGISPDDEYTLMIVVKGE